MTPEKQAASLCLESDVSLSYDAKFGPDIADVNLWQDICTKWADVRKASS